MEYRGFYVGTVVDNNDTTDKDIVGYTGRIKVSVPAVYGKIGKDTLPWAEPCFPYASEDRGMFFIPEKNAKVLVVFDNGSSDKPIWLGCLYNENDSIRMPRSALLNYPDRKVIKTGTGEIMFDDKDNIMEIEHKNGSIIRIDKDGSVSMCNAKGTGIIVNNKTNSVDVINGKNFLTVKQNGICMSNEDGSEMDVSSKGITIKSGTNLDILAVGNVNIASGGNVTINNSTYKTLASTPPTPSMC